MPALAPSFNIPGLNTGVGDIVSFLTGPSSPLAGLNINDLIQRAMANQVAQQGAVNQLNTSALGQQGTEFQSGLTAQQQQAQAQNQLEQQQIANALAEQKAQDAIAQRQQQQSEQGQQFEEGQQAQAANPFYQLQTGQIAKAVNTAAPTANDILSLWYSTHPYMQPSPTTRYPNPASIPQQFTPIA